jgi:cell division protein FtsB
MKWLAAGLVVVIVLLQYRLWLSDDGVRELGRLQTAVAAQKGENERLAQRNSQLAGEVRDLKSGMAALEERARSELGMVAPRESFYQVVPHAPAFEPSGDPRTRTAAR